MLFFLRNRCLELGAMYLVLILISTHLHQVATIPLIRANKPGNISLGGLFLLTDLDRNEKCRNTFSLDGMRSFLAMLFAVERINSDDSILPNITLGTKVFDTCTSRVSSLDYTLKYFVFGDDKAKLSQYPIVGLIGPLTSYEAVTISKVLEIFEIPVISYSATSYELSDKKQYEYFSRTTPSDDSQTKAMAELLEYFNWTRVSIVYTDDSYGQHGFELLKRQAAKRGICFEMEIELPSFYNNATYRNKIGQLTKETTNVIVLFCVGQPIVHIFETMASVVKHFNSLQLITSEAIGKTWILSEITKIKAGFIYTRFMTNTIEDYEEYLSNLSVAKMNNSWFKQFYEQVMNCTFENMSKSAQRCNSSEKMGNKLWIDYSIDQVSDKVIDAVYAFAHGLQRVLYTPCPNNLTNCLPSSKITGKLLLDFIRNYSFPSADGRKVHLDINGEVDGGYTFHYVLPSQKKSAVQYIKIGQWKGHLKMNSTLIAGLKLVSTKEPCSKPCSNDMIQQRKSEKPCCWICKKCSPGSILVNKTHCHACDRGFLPNTEKRKCVKIEEIYFSLDDRVSKLLVVPQLVLSSCGMLAVIFLLYIFMKFNSNSLVKASGRELCYLLLAGLFLSYVFPIVCICRPSRLKCLSQFILDSLPTTISFVTIAVKTNRIFRIFDPTRKLTDRPLFVRPPQQIIVSFLLICVQILLLLTLVIVQIPMEKLVYFSSTEVHLVCSTSKTQILIAHLYNLILIIVCTYYAYKTRNIPSRFNETKYIAFAMYASCMIAVTFMIVFLVAASRKEDDIFKLGIHCYRVVLMSTVILLCVFAPKVYAILFQRSCTMSSRSSSKGDAMMESNLRCNQAHSRNSNCMAVYTEEGSRAGNEVQIHRDRQDCRRWTI